ncbi:MAG: hypothetical protein MZV49_06675 [Rhodopseudomonas palustris]|nr:hypothetical protein [Rhodopseudomonas palustris]
MTDIQIYLTLGVFAAVILLIAFDVVDMAVAALLGVCVLIMFGILDSRRSHARSCKRPVVRSPCSSAAWWWRG